MKHITFVKCTLYYIAFQRKEQVRGFTFLMHDKIIQLYSEHVYAVHVCGFNPSIRFADPQSPHPFIKNVHAF